MMSLACQERNTTVCCAT